MSTFVKLDDVFINLDLVQYVKYEHTAEGHYLNFVFEHNHSLENHLMKEFDTYEQVEEVLRRSGIEQ